MKNLLEETIKTLEHAKVFICTRQKMHPEGVMLYDENLEKLIKRLNHEKFICELEEHLTKQEENKEINTDSKELLKS